MITLKKLSFLGIIIFFIASCKKEVYPRSNTATNQAFTVIETSDPGHDDMRPKKFAKMPE